MCVRARMRTAHVLPVCTMRDKRVWKIARERKENWLRHRKDKRKGEGLWRVLDGKEEDRKGQETPPPNPQASSPGIPSPDSKDEN